MNIFNKLLLALGLAAFTHLSFAHGDVTPQAVDTSSLPQLGATWKEVNPYRDTKNSEIMRIGSSAYNQNCARCHGLEAISGGIAPDLRKTDSDCTGLADAAKKSACFNEIDNYFATVVRNGRVRNGAVYMPPFEGILQQEAVWAIKVYVESRREK